MEVASVLEEIAAHDAAMPEIAIAFEMAVTIAPGEIVVPIGPVEQTPVAVTIAEAGRTTMNAVLRFTEHSMELLQSRRSSE